MQFSATLLVVSLVALVLEVNSSQQQRRKKKEGKSRGAVVPSKLHRGKMRKLWVNLDPVLTSSSESSQVSPKLSMSPWTYEASYDESRIPSHIFEARCETTGCMTLSGYENAGLESKPIYYQILVLRRVKGKKQKYLLQLEKMTISVGCTCVLPNVISKMQ